MIMRCLRRRRRFGNGRNHQRLLAFAAIYIKMQQEIQCYRFLDLNEEPVTPRYRTVE